jgi:hypothetical protein
MPKLLPIRFRLPAMTCFPGLQSMSFKDLVLIPFCVARATSRREGPSGPGPVLATAGSSWRADGGRRWHGLTSESRLFGVDCHSRISRVPGFLKAAACMIPVSLLIG